MGIRDLLTIRVTPYPDVGGAREVMFSKGIWIIRVSLTSLAMGDKSKLAEAFEKPSMSSCPRWAMKGAQGEVCGDGSITQQGQQVGYLRLCLSRYLIATTL